ncbi:MAG: hypothetical protein ABJO67_21635, partial [Pseudoruegeria sp.]
METKIQHRIGFDMDEVICDTHGSLLRWAEVKFNLDLTCRGNLPIDALLTSEQFKEMTTMLNEGSFFGTLAPM